MISIVQYYGVKLDLNFLKEIFPEDLQEAEDKYEGEEIDIEFFYKINMEEYLTEPDGIIKIEKLYMSQSIVIGLSSDVDQIESGDGDCIEIWKPNDSDVEDLHRYMTENDILKDKEPEYFIYCNTNS